jgi:hypothetical protein
MEWGVIVLIFNILNGMNDVSLLQRIISEHVGGPLRLEVESSIAPTKYTNFH